MDSYLLATDLQSTKPNTDASDSLSGIDSYGLILVACLCPSCGILLVDDIPIFVSDCKNTEDFCSTLADLKRNHLCGVDTVHAGSSMI